MNKWPYTLTAVFFLSLTAWHPICAEKSYSTGYTSSSTEKDLLEESYLNQYQKRSPIYQSAPVTHIVPSLKTITFALAAYKYDVKIKDDDFDDKALESSRAEHKLTLSGHAFSPYVAVSLEKIGLGFSGETGSKNTEYKRYNKDDHDAKPSYYRHQKSDMEYTAIGVYAYLLPYQQKGKNPITASMMMGVKNHNVRHETTPEMTNEIRDDDFKKYRYNVTTYQVGGLVDFQLLRKFSLIPWAEYVWIDAHDPIGQADDILKKKSTSTIDKASARNLKAESHMFWLDRPKLEIGLDLVLRLGGFALHIGDLMGMVISPIGTEAITDNTIYISISNDMKGN
jgi:hypothetical protein